MNKLLSYCLALVLVTAPPSLEAFAQKKRAAASRADLTTVYRADERANRDVTYRDARLLEMRETDTKYQLPMYPTREAWEKRAERLRERVLVSAGLWPLPEKTPLNAKVFDRIERDDYTVEKAYFESYPGFFVGGNLYRPKGKKGPFPAILTPHGHWSLGRTTHTELGSIPARSINFARQGYLVFAYDMVGYGDTRQINHSYAADSLSQLWGISLLGLQLWNSMRALDFLTSLPDVDVERLGITGASGGATQAFLLTAVDKEGHIKVTAPVNMISTQMQGGCLCENAPGLRLNTFNVEIAALAAPRPLLMVSNTQDWTVNTPWAEYPMMESIYRLYHAEERLANAHFDYPHNYNEASREAVYAWFARWLLGDEDASEYREQPVEVEDDEDLLVFLKSGNSNRDLTFADMPSGQYTAPPDSTDAEELSAYLQQLAVEQFQEAWPTDETGLDAFRKVYGTAYQHVLAAEFPAAISAEPRGAFSHPDFVASKWLISRSEEGDWIPSVWYQPGTAGNAATVVVAPEGKSALVKTGMAEPVELVNTLLTEGQSVLAIDVFKTGEHVLQEGTETARDEQFEFFTTFNRTDVQERVQDILTAVSFLKRQGVENVNLIGIGEAGTWALLAAGVAGDVLDHVVAYHTTANIDDATDALRYFIPGLLRVGGLQAAAALAAPVPLLLVESDFGFDHRAVARVYEIADVPGNYKSVSGPQSLREMIEWMED